MLPRPRRLLLCQARTVPITPGKGAGADSRQHHRYQSVVHRASAAATRPAACRPPPRAKTISRPRLRRCPRPAKAVGPARNLWLNVNFVEVPVTVKDSKGNLVAGLTWRDFKVFENDTREPLGLFTVDPFPLSIAFVIDQSLTSDVMAKVNDSLGAIQGALTPYDEVAVFSYNNGAAGAHRLYRRPERPRCPPCWP